MFSREASKKLRQEFWISFGKSYPRKWLLYNTRIKGLFLKFHFDTRNAMVSIDIEDHNLENRIHLWEKLLSLKAILQTSYLPNAIFEEICLMENGKEISRVYVIIENVSIHDKNTWQETMLFLSEQMDILENFYQEFNDVLKA
jgi:hypothetical protein